MPHLDLAGVRLVYAGSADQAPFVAVDEVSLQAEPGEFVALVGPSGCGKSSLLLAVSGLLRPERGTIRLNGRAVVRPGQGSALVFQDAALLPWRTALKNVELGLELQGRPRSVRTEQARRGLRLVGLAAFERHYPHQLSGGMRQRVGLARALATEPEVLLMDEPFGALDAQTRHLMAAELLRIWERDRKTILFVTHDIDEAIYLSDRVVVMSANPGRVLDVLSISLPRPRDLEMRNHPAFASYRRRIWQHLEREVQAAVAWQQAGHDGGQ